MTDHAAVSRWLAAYEDAWRTSGTETLTHLFTPDASYLMSPYETPFTGLDAISLMWERERDGPDEEFTFSKDIVAVDGPTAVVRVEVHYGEPAREYRDLWILQIRDDGLCTAFEEWPFSPA